MNIPASRAARILDELRALAASGALGEVAGRRVTNVFRNHGIPALGKCEGEAHGTVHADNCLVCAPRWGAVGEVVTVARSKP